MIKKIKYNDYEFQIDFDRPYVRFKGGPPKAPVSPPPVPVRYSAEAEAAKRDIIERNKGARGRAASIASSPGLASIIPNLETPKLKGTLG